MKYAFYSAFAIAALTGCASSGGYEMSDKVAARLAEFDRTGDMESCLNTATINQIDALDARNFLVRVGVNTYYLNETSGCSSAGRSGYRLQYTTSISQLCRNQIITVVDNTTGMTAGSCGLGSFEKLEKKAPEDAS